MRLKEKNVPYSLSLNLLTGDLEARQAAHHLPEGHADLVACLGTHEMAWGKGEIFSKKSGLTCSPNKPGRAVLRYKGIVVLQFHCTHVRKILYA